MTMLKKSNAKIIVKEKSAGMRLDKFLAGKAEDATRSNIQKKIKSGSILINNEKKTPHYFLKQGDIVLVKKEKKNLNKTKNLKPNALLLENKKQKPKKNFKIIFENDEFLIINKPAGLIAHGAEHIKETTMSDLLLKKYPQLKNVGEDEGRPGIVHRLDKDASGLLVVAKTQESFINLKKQFSSRLAKKEYLILVYGRIDKDESEINFPIKRASSGNKQAAVPESYNKKEKARSAATSFEVVERLVNYTLLKVKTKTGRKHQIRVHFSAYGHPLVGDNLYHTKKTKELNKKLGLNRIFLVAVNLSFRDLAGEKREYKIGLPKELKDFFQKIK